MTDIFREVEIEGRGVKLTGRAWFRVDYYHHGERVEEVSVRMTHIGAGLAINAGALVGPEAIREAEDRVRQALIEKEDAE